MMYRALMELYRRGKVSDTGIEKAVSDGVITAAQAAAIKEQTRCT